MIKFVVTIDQNGVHCETSPGVASPHEIAIATKFKQAFADWAKSLGLFSGWKSPNNEIREDN